MMRASAALPALLCFSPALAAVPVQDSSMWENLRFRGISPNEVSFSSAGIKIQVRSSASPLIFPLSSPKRISRVKVRLEAAGRLSGSGKSGVWDEDSRFRLGLVVPGKKSLTAWSKAASPAWVKRLFSLAPRGAGIDRIEFLMLGRPPAQIGDRRTHPSSELIEERVVWTADAVKEELRLEAVLDPPLDVSALWISADGDQSRSQFELLIRSIELDFVVGEMLR